MPCQALNGKTQGGGGGSGVQVHYEQTVRRLPRPAQPSGRLRRPPPRQRAGAFCNASRGSAGRRPVSRDLQSDNFRLNVSTFCG